MKGYSSGDIMDRREQRASKMTKWKWLRPFWNRLSGVIKWENAIRRCSANKCMVQIFRYLLQVTVLANLENDQTDSYADQDMWMIYQGLLFILYQQIKVAWSCELRRLSLADLVYD